MDNIMTKFDDISDQIKVLKEARNILRDKYEETDFHKKKERNPHSPVTPSPDDEEIYKLLTAIQQLEFYVKKLQDEQFTLLKEQE
jgi:hypothetical protein